MRIYDLIPTAPASITKAELMAITGLDERSVRQQVHRERRAGYHILTSSTSSGYYRPQNTSDVEGFVKSMRHRAAETVAVADAMEDSLMREVGQTKLEGI